eukprot:m.1158917 g.1158917  ORF g.1158917 m.1158917 type:complete len:68 (+) comp24501_c0_seq9:3319-3522(+)
MHSLLSFGGSTGEASMGSILNCPAYGDRSLYHFADNSATALGSIPMALYISPKHTTSRNTNTQVTAC